MTYLWLKLIHLFFVISWFAGLFYLPRIFVNLASCDPESPEYARLLTMANKLYRFMTPLGVFALIFGLGVVAYLSWWTAGIWVHIKILIGIILAAYHMICWRILLRFRHKNNVKNHVFYRWFNEFPVIMLLLALYLVIIKPF